MNETFSDKTSAEPSKDSVSLNARVIELIMKKPRRWSELKKLTNSSSSTLFRVLTELENSNLVEREFVKKKIQWKITGKGKDRALDADVIKFIRNGVRIEGAGLMDFDHWVPLEKPRMPASEKSSETGETGDKEFENLDRNYMLKLLFKGQKDEILDRKMKEEELMFAFAMSHIFASEAPSNSRQITKFAKNIVTQILKNKEDLFRWLIPRNRTKLKNSSELTSNVLFVFEVELTARKKLLDDLLKFPVRGDKKNSAGT